MAHNRLMSPLPIIMQLFGPIEAMTLPEGSEARRRLEELDNNRLNIGPLETRDGYMFTIYRSATQESHNDDGKVSLTSTALQSVPNKFLRSFRPRIGRSCSDFLSRRLQEISTPRHMMQMMTAIALPSRHFTSPPLNPMSLAVQVRHSARDQLWSIISSGISCEIAPVSPPFATSSADLSPRSLARFFQSLCRIFHCYIFNTFWDTFVVLRLSLILTTVALLISLRLLIECRMTILFPVPSRRPCN